MFDSQQYLRKNPDVDAAIKAGSIPSAWFHFTRFGYMENREAPCIYDLKGEAKGIRETVTEVLTASYPLPPPELIARVHGSADRNTFSTAGKLIALDLYDALLKATGAPPSGMILDFGCGSGRVLAPMGILLPQATLCGTDIDAEAIHWGRENLMSMNTTLFVNNDLPPLCFADGTFDCIYSISVFTHLPEDMQHQWLQEIFRLLKPGGIACLSVANEKLVRPHLTPGELQEASTRGFFYKAFQGTQGLPDYYQAAWHSADYVRREWGRIFEILQVIPSGIAGHQDLVVARRPLA